ncbi:hypothetical protein GJ496_010232 [Pomphorhynchus laevis]|nr:hypothetical protein GJ496_010232 [Pomphorhynchus laevis]
MIYSTILPQLYQSSTNHNYSSSLTYKLLHKYRLLNKGHKKDRFDYITAILPIPSYVKNIPVPGFELNRIYDKRPTFTQRLRSRVIQESLHVKLSCLIDSDSNAQVTWARGRTILLPGDLHYDIRFNHGICTLEIQSCQMADMAEYTCKVENQYGFDETSAFLCVERRSKKPNDINIEMSDIKPSFEKPLERQDTTDKQRETTKIVKSYSLWTVCSLFIVLFGLFALNSLLRNVLFRMFSLDSSPWTVFFEQFSLDSSPWTVLFGLFSLNSSLCTVLFGQFYLYCSLCTVLFGLFSMYCHL